MWDNSTLLSIWAQWEPTLKYQKIVLLSFHAESSTLFPKSIQMKFRYVISKSAFETQVSK